MEKIRTGATKDLARSLRTDTRWPIPLPRVRGHHQLSGPSSFGLIYSAEIFFAVLAVAILFQALIPLSNTPLNFGWWHFFFMLALLFHAAWLMYSGLRREYSPKWVALAAYITYGAYIFWPLAANDTTTYFPPWCWLIGLYGMVTPICLGHWKAIVANVLGYSAALALSLYCASLTTRLPVIPSEIFAQVFYLAALLTLVSVLFGTSKIYAERSDVLYAETLAAQLQLTRTRDQSKDLQEFDKLVHDNVMAALLDASRLEGPIADRTVTLARRAISVLEEETNRVRPQNPVTFQKLTEQIANGIYPWNSRLRFVADSEGLYPKADPLSSIPPEAARAFTHAVTEAVSNSARHSGTRTTQISVRTELRRPHHSPSSAAEVPFIFCTVTDYGQGFNVKNLDLRRMGVRVSMLRSMEETGGKVTIKSVPYRGTEVIVQWPGED